MMLLPLGINETILRALGFFSLAAGALLFIPRVREIIVAPFRAWRKRRREQRDKLSRVLALLAPNGGRSIADAIQRIEEQLTALALESKQQSELQYAYFDLQEQPLLYADSIGDCIFANRSFCDITGIRADDARGSGWARALHGADRIGVVAEIQAAAREQRAYSLVCRLVHQGTAATTQVRATGRPIRRNSGEISGHLRFFTITARDVP